MFHLLPDIRYVRVRFAHRVPQLHCAPSVYVSGGYGLNAGRTQSTCKIYFARFVIRYQCPTDTLIVSLWDARPPYVPRPLQYWRHEFPALLSSTRLKPYVVLATEPLPEKARPTAPRGHRIRKSRVAEVELARDCDLGRNDDRVRAVSHLGHILRAGDTVLGYDVSSANLPEGEASDLRESLPDVVLVRKVYPRIGHDGGKEDRHWKLRELEKDDGGDGGGGVSAARDETAAERDYERFLQQLESDRDMRRQVNLFKSRTAPATNTAAMDAMEHVEEMDAEEVRLEELLDEMTLDDANAGPDGAESVGGSAGIFEAGAAPAPNSEALPSLDDDPAL